MDELVSSAVGVAVDWEGTGVEDGNPVEAGLSVGTGLWMLQPAIKINNKQVTPARQPMHIKPALERRWLL